MDTFYKNDVVRADLEPRGVCGPCTPVLVEFPGNSRGHVLQLCPGAGGSQRQESAGFKPAAFYRKLKNKIGKES